MQTDLTNKLVGDSDVVKALTLNDFSMNASSAISTVIFTLFVIKQINGGTIAEVGISQLIFLGVSALLNMPLAKLLDKTKGYIDEGTVLALSSVLRGISLMILAFSHSIWELYLYQALLGVARSMDLTAWRVLFSKFLDMKKPAVQWATYDAVIAIGIGIATVIAGYLGDTVPFSYVIFLAGVVSLLGALFPLFVFKELRVKSN